MATLIFEKVSEMFKESFEGIAPSLKLQRCTGRPGHYRLVINTGTSDGVLATSPCKTGTNRAE